jgi:hypothetical protein
MAQQISFGQLQHGDILLSEGTSLRVKVGQALLSHNFSGGKSNVTHASVYDIQNPNGMLTSAVPRAGVWRFENDRPGMVYHVYRYRGPNATPIVYQAVAQARQYVERTQDEQHDPNGFGRYSDMRAANTLVHSSSFGAGAQQALVRLREDPFCRRTFFCSQFVVQCYQLATASGQAPAIRADSRHTSPKALQARLNEDPNWEYVGYLLTTGGPPSRPPSRASSPVGRPQPRLQPVRNASPAASSVSLPDGVRLVDLSTTDKRAQLAELFAELRDVRDVPELPVDLSLVNPNRGGAGRGDNCQACAVAVDGTLAGFGMSAAALRPGEAAPPERLEEVYRTRFSDAENWQDVIDTAKRLGAGTRLIVSIKRPVTMGASGHVFNIIIDEYDYPAIIDGQGNLTCRLDFEINDYLRQAALTNGIQYIVTNGPATGAYSPPGTPPRRVLRVANPGSGSDSD